MSQRTPRETHHPERWTPLSELTPAHQRRIKEAVAASTPPPKYLTIPGIAQIPSRAWAEWHLARGTLNGRVKVPRWMREAVIVRDDFICGLCGDAVEPHDVHLDHIVPWSRGGENSVDNLQVTHAACNLAKGARVG